MKMLMLMCLSILIKILLFKVLIDYLLWHIIEQMLEMALGILLEMGNENIVYQELI